MTYNTPEFIDAEVRYRRERLARDWRAHRGENVVTGSSAHWARVAVAAITGLRPSPGRHRHA